VFQKFIFVPEARQTEMTREVVVIIVIFILVCLAAGGVAVVAAAGAAAAERVLEQGRGIDRGHDTAALGAHNTART